MLIPQASNTAATVDKTFSVILSIEVVVLTLVTSTMIFFVLKYNRRRHEQSESIEGSTVLEIVWTVIPTLLVLGMFLIGWRSFAKIREVPREVMTIKVLGRQWSWLFHYENGRESDKLIVPVGKPVKLLLTSADVIHSLYIPAFRIKEDCVPRMETYLWFTARQAGSYDIFCTEYCGLGHSGMVTKIITMPEKDFAAWYSGPAEAGLNGGEILQRRGCLGCHSTDGTKKIGPTFKGLYGSRVTIVTDGQEREIIADGEYLRRSILQPGADVVKGFPNIMPALPLNREEIDAVIEYLKTLK